MDRMADDRMRPQRTKSPLFDRQPSQRKMAMRRPDPDTEEFMRFVRESQMERQPTQLGLKKKAPLPSIGQSGNCDIRDSIFLDKLNGNTLENNFENINRSRDPRNDPILREILMLGKSNNQLIYNSIPNRFSYSSGDFSMISRQNCDLTHKSRKSKRRSNDLKSRHVKSKLPPLQLDDLPERPSAPSPSVTPPLPYSDDCSSEERIEWLDI